jgi:hypothetical protein
VAQLSALGAERTLRQLAASDASLAVKERAATALEQLAPPRAPAAAGRRIGMLPIGGGGGDSSGMATVLSDEEEAEEEGEEGLYGGEEEEEEGMDEEGRDVSIM